MKDLSLESGDTDGFKNCQVVLGARHDAGVWRGLNIFQLTQQPAEWGSRSAVEITQLHLANITKYKYNSTQLEIFRSYATQLQSQVIFTDLPAFLAKRQNPWVRVIGVQTPLFDP